MTFFLTTLPLWLSAVILIVPTTLLAMAGPVIVRLRLSILVRLISKSGTSVRSFWAVQAQTRQLKREQSLWWEFGWIPGNLCDLSKGYFVTTFLSSSPTTQPRSPVSTSEFKPIARRSRHLPCHACKTTCTSALPKGSHLRVRGPAGVQMTPRVLRRIKGTCFCQPARHS
jgi:hypothetical protein